MSDGRRVVQNLAIHLNLQSLRLRRQVFEISFGTRDANTLQRIGVELQRAIAGLNSLDRYLERAGQIVEEEASVLMIEDERRGVKRRNDVEVEDLEYNDL